MIRSLYIKNYALVDELTIEFASGLNVLTGETGAGKSILVNAIGQLCGERSSSDLVRNGAQKAIIEIQIDAGNKPELAKLFAELELDWPEDKIIIIRKEINLNGTTRTFINDTPITLNRLSRLSALLIDLHGQHQHQQLLHPENHIIYLDAYGNLDNDARAFSVLLKKYNKTLRVLEELKEEQLKSFQLQDMYRYQYDELKKAELNADELENLRAEMKILANVEALHQLGASLSGNLYSGEINVSELLGQAQHDVQQLAQLDSEFETYIEILAQASASVEEIGRFTEQYISRLEFNPERMEFIHQRISQLEFLLKKYQKNTIAELMEYHQEIASLLEGHEQFDERIAEKEDELSALSDEIIGKGKALSQKRRKVAGSFEEKINHILIKIGMPNARFRVQHKYRQRDDGQFTFEGERCAADSRGFDAVHFELASNAGENFKPLQKIASGGEISRLMLALKSVLADADRIPTLVFDEIDAGISGKIAQHVGREMAGLAHLHQLICVTHLPQIAAFAGAHFKAYKSVENNHTFIRVTRLEDVRRVEEIAALLGGQKISEHALQNARHLIKEARTLQAR